MSNKYLSYVSDDHLLQCIREVIHSYPDPDKPPDTKSIDKNTVDPFKVLFDCCIKGLGVEAWTRDEIARQNDKTINNATGNFHQKLLGGVQGWVDLGTGDSSEVDLKKEDNSVFIELKNKHNTVNSASMEGTRNKLARVLGRYPNADAYYAFIITANGKSGTIPFKYLGIVTPRLYKVFGKDVYTLVTGNPGALDELAVALPRAIMEVVGIGVEFTEEDNRLLTHFLHAAF
jgi:hypothetical protein